MTLKLFIDGELIKSVDIGENIRYPNLNIYEQAGGDEEYIREEAAKLKGDYESKILVCTTWVIFLTVGSRAEVNQQKEAA